MMNFKNSKTAKVVSGFVGLATAVMMMGPAIASAATVEELTAQINALLAQVTALQATQTSSSQTTMTTSGSGYQFTADLTMGSKGQSVTELQMILVAKGFLTMPAGVAMGYFGGLTKSAVMAWQASAGIMPAAGYVGPKSRAALNGMSGSSSSSTTTTTTTTGMVPGCSSTTGFSITNGQSCATGAVVSTVAGCTSTTGFSPTTGQACSAGTTSVVPAGSGVTVRLDATSPMNQTLISPQGVATLAVFNISNGGAAAAKVTMLKFKRTGISSDSTLNNVYLYSGAARLTDSSSVSQGMVNFSDAAGIITVPAMGSVVVAVRGDIATGANGQTLGIMLTEATADTGTVAGLPVSGDSSTFATAPSGMASADFTGGFSPLSGAIDPQNDYTVWQKSIQIGNRDALLSSIRFQQIGSIYSTDVTNFRLMIDGVQVGTAVAAIDANRFVTFSFATPATLKAGTHVIKVMADIVGGSSRNFNFSLRRVVDVELWDSQLNVVLTPTVGTAAFTTTGMQSTIAVSINAGSLTVTKDTSSPSGNVVLNGSNVTLAKFKFRAQGEDLKVESLTFNYTGNGANVLAPTLRSAAVYANGVQVGSTQNLASTTAGTQFNLGSSLILAAGKDVVVEVRSDVFNNGTGAALAANDTIVANLIASTGNVYQRSSLGYIGNSAIAGNTLTVATGNLTLAKYTAYANPTVTVPQSAYKIGDFRLTTGSTEGVNLDTITLALGGTMTVTDLTNLYVVYGSKTSQFKAAGAASQTFSINEAVASNGTMSFAVYANINANPVAGSTTVATLTVSGTSQSSGSAVTSAAVGGQTLAVGSGSITSALDASTPTSVNVVANTMPLVASFKFSALNDTFTISELTFKASSTVDVGAISELVYKNVDGSEIARASFNGMYATTSGLSIPVTYNGTKIINVYASLGGVGTGFATSSAWVNVTLDGFEYMNSNGVKTRDYNDRAGNAMFAFKTKPIVTNVALPTSLLAAGTMTIGRVQIAADAAGPVHVNRIIFNVATSSATVVSPLLYDDADSSTVISTCTLNGTATQITCGSINKEVSGTKVYSLKATVGGSIITGASVSTNIAAPSTAHVVPTTAANVETTTASFVWSDESVVGHSLTTADWMGDYLVKNFPTDSQTMTK